MYDLIKYQDYFPNRTAILNIKQLISHLLHYLSIDNTWRCSLLHSPESVVG